MSDRYALLEAWLEHEADVASSSLPPDELVAHVSDCPRCRTALIALLADRIGPEARSSDRDCAAVELEIPAFVDYEQAYGLVAAARAFPDVWWHSLVCPDCAELYQALQALAAPAEGPAQVAVSLATPRWPIMARLQLHPGVVRQFIGAQRLGARWGPEQDDVTVAEERGEIGVIRVSLRQEPPASLALVVRTDPPIAGAVVLALAGASYSEPLDSHGCAVFSGLAETLFVGGDAPQITLTIHPPAP